MEKHLSSIRNTGLKSTAIGKPMSDSHLVVLVQGSPPASWETTTFVLNATASMDKDGVVTRIVSEEDRRGRHAPRLTSLQRRWPEIYHFLALFSIDCKLKCI